MRLAKCFSLPAPKLDLQKVVLHRFAVGTIGDVPIDNLIEQVFRIRMSGQEGSLKNISAKSGS